MNFAWGKQATKLIKSQPCWVHSFKPGSSGWWLCAENHVPKWHRGSQQRDRGEPRSLGEEHNNYFSSPLEAASPLCRAWTGWSSHKPDPQTSLVVQCLRRICLPMQVTQVQSLVQEDLICGRATKPLSLKSRNKRNNCNEKPAHCN